MAIAMNFEYDLHFVFLPKHLLFFCFKLICYQDQIFDSMDLIIAITATDHHVNMQFLTL